MIYLLNEMAVPALVALCLGVVCGFAERWFRHRRGGTHD
jgi:hypothetical protein